MKLTPRLFGLMMALSVGTAAAAGTTAGTAITNTATASFVDPNDTAATALSNTVEAVVLPQANFDIQYFGGNSDGTLANDTATNKIPAAYKGNVKNTASPDNQLVSKYNLVNTGNVNNYTVELLTDTGTLTDATVEYFSDAALKNKITQLMVLADDVTTTKDEGVVEFYQVITVPTTAKAGDLYAASPRGKANGGTVGVAAAPYGAVSEDAADLQFAQATVYTPKLTVGPGPINPNNPSSPPINTPTGTPSPNVPPTTPGYTDPLGNTVGVNGNDQTVYPKAGVTAVIFNNVVTNNGNLIDTVNLSPDGFTSGPDANGIFTMPNGTTVQFLDNQGNPLIIPVLTVPAATGPTAPGTASFQTLVTLPANLAADPALLVTKVNIDSGNDVDLLPDGSANDTIAPPAVDFGDSNGAAVGVTNTQPTEFVDPRGSISTGTPATDQTANAANDSSAVFPMDVVNYGEYGDTFTLSGTVNIDVIDANGNVTSTPVPARYVDQNSNPLTPGTAANTYVTPVIAKNDELKVFAIVDVPAGAKAGTYTVSQTATGVYSNVTKSDGDNKITVKSVNTAPTNPSGISIDKYQTRGVTAPTGSDATQKDAITALPGDTLNYAIIAKNNYNSTIKMFELSDAASSQANLYSYSKFVSASVTPSNFPVNPAPKVMYKVDNGAYSLNAPAAGAVTNSLVVAVDTNNDGIIDASDVMPANASLRLDIKVILK